MKLLIEIPDKHRSNIEKKFNSKGTIDGIFDYLKKVEKASVEIIPDNATNGDVIKTIIKALFPDMGLADNFGFWVNLIDEGGHGVGDFYAIWMNAPYKGGE